MHYTFYLDFFCVFQVLCIILLLVNVAELLGLIIRQQTANVPLPPVDLFVPGVQGFLMVNSSLNFLREI